MFLDGGQPVDAVVVGVALVIGGDQALARLGSPDRPARPADVPIEQQVLAGTRRPSLRHRQRFDQADILDGRADLLELA
jgi:hypothetical protein